MSREQGKSSCLVASGWKHNHIFASHSPILVFAPGTAWVQPRRGSRSTWWFTVQDTLSHGPLLVTQQHFTHIYLELINEAELMNRVQV